MAVAIPIISGQGTEEIEGENLATYTATAWTPAASTDSSTPNITRIKSTGSAGQNYPPEVTTTIGGETDTVRMSKISMSIFADGLHLYISSLAASTTSYLQVTYQIMTADGLQYAKNIQSATAKQTDAQLTLTYGDGTITMNLVTASGTTTLTANSSWILLPNADGDMAVLSGTTAWISTGDKAYWTSADATNGLLTTAAGTPGEKIQARAASSTGAWTGEASGTGIVSKQMQGYQLGDLQLSIDTIPEITSATLVAAPVEYSYYEQKEGTVWTLTNLIPLLMMVGLILAVVTAYLTKKMEE